jgi:hypothetical protein
MTSVTDLKNASVSGAEENRRKPSDLPLWLRVVLALLALALTAAIFLAYNQTGLVFDLFSLRYCG